MRPHAGGRNLASGSQLLGRGEVRVRVGRAPGSAPEAPRGTLFIRRAGRRAPPGPSARGSPDRLSTAEHGDTGAARVILIQGHDSPRVKNDGQRTTPDTCAPRARVLSDDPPPAPRSGWGLPQGCPAVSAQSPPC